MTQNTNPKCARCGHETYGAGQWCQNHGDQADYAPVYVSENRDRWSVEGRYPERQRRLRWAEEVPLPGFEGLV